MAFILITLGALTAIVVWAFFHYRPQGAKPALLRAFNAVVIVAGLAAGVAAYQWIVAGAAAVPEKQRYAVLLALFAAGAVFDAVLAVAGFLRNMVVFRGAGGTSDAPPPG